MDDVFNDDEDDTAEGNQQTPEPLRHLVRHLTIERKPEKQGSEVFTFGVYLRERVLAWVLPTG
jgi:hypothetical protein